MISNIAIGSTYRFYFFVCARLKREKSVRKNIHYINLCKLAPTESTGIEHPNDV